MSEELTRAQRAEIEAQLRAGRKLAAIRRYRELTGAGLKQAKEAVERMEQGAPRARPEPRPRRAGVRGAPPIEEAPGRRRFITPLIVVIAAGVLAQTLLWGGVPTASELEARLLGWLEAAQRLFY